MKIKLLGIVTSFGLLSASPSYAWECGVTYVQGQVWNGNAATTSTSYGFWSIKACEEAATDFETKGRSAIAMARPGLTREGIKSAFWHTCKPGC